MRPQPVRNQDIRDPSTYSPIHCQKGFILHAIQKLVRWWRRLRRRPKMLLKGRAFPGPRAGSRQSVLILVSSRMNSQQQQQPQQRVSELRMRRWAGRGQQQAAHSTAGSSSSGGAGSTDLELSLRSLNASFSTSETVICETPVSTNSDLPHAQRTDSIISSEFEFCRPRSNNSRCASPLHVGSPCCPASPSPSRTPRSPRSPRSPMTPCSPALSSSPQPGAGYSSSARRRSGAVVGNLARLASRRSSRDSEAGEPSPLQCSRINQRRTSNFLEIPGEDKFLLLCTYLKHQHNFLALSRKCHVTLSSSSYLCLAVVQRPTVLL